MKPLVGGGICGSAVCPQHQYVGFLLTAAFISFTVVTPTRNTEPRIQPSSEAFPVINYRPNTFVFPALFSKSAHSLFIENAWTTLDRHTYSYTIQCLAPPSPRLRRDLSARLEQIRLMREINNGATEKALCRTSIRKRAQVPLARRLSFVGDTTTNAVNMSFRPFQH